MMISSFIKQVWRGEDSRWGLSRGLGRREYLCSWLLVLLTENANQSYYYSEYVFKESGDVLLF